MAAGPGEQAQRPSEPLLSPGELVDHFKVVRLVGRGGMGEVYLARDTKLGRRVALKIVRPGALGGGQAAAQFVAEARITARFNHPHIVAIYSVGEHRGTPYVALEYLEGETLRRRVRRQRPSMREVVRIGLAIAEALAEAHRHKVLHRDLKPENVLLPTDGRLRVVDFGLAKAGVPPGPAGRAGLLASDEDPETLALSPGQARASQVDLPGGLCAPPPTVVVNTSLSLEEQCDTVVDPVPAGASQPAATLEPADEPTESGPVRRSGVATKPIAADLWTAQRAAARGVMGVEVAGERILGTPFYMAPEQWRGEPCDSAADVWALGVILFELVSGRIPFHGASTTEIRSQVTAPGPGPSLVGVEGVPAVLAELIGKCLAKEAAARPSAEEVATALRGALLLDRERPSKEATPFRGLLPFSERHADFFFGREAEVATFLERLRDEPVLPIVGPSGAGKSSFVQAGVVPRLREQGRWIVLTLRPGSTPLDALAKRLAAGEGEFSGGSTMALRAQSTVRVPSELSSRVSLSGEVVAPDESLDLQAPTEPLDADALRESPGRLALALHQMAEACSARILLFVDQLEELYTLTADQAVRRAFMEAVCLAADDPLGPVRVVLTLRDDFLGRVAETPAARRALAHITVLRSPDDEALRETLLKPLELVGYEIDDPSLPELMIAAVRGEPAGLPVLQFACSRLWELRDATRRKLTRSAYDAMGGVEGALARHADEVLAGLSGEQSSLARIIFLRLVTPEGTRRVVPRSELLEGLGAEAEEVLDRLTKARAILVRKGRDRGDAAPELELIHESLIRNWERLARWIDESREEVAFLAEVQQAAELWRKRGRPREEVWRGATLHDAQRRASLCAAVPEHVRQFLDAGQALESQRARRRRLVLALVIGSLGLAALVFVAVALVFAAKEREARFQRAEAQREGARSALERGDMLEARAKLRGSLETSDSPLARALWWRLRESPVAWRVEPGSLVNAVAFSPDGRVVAAGCANKSIALIDVRTLAIRTLRGHPDQVFGVDFSPDGRLLAASTLAGHVGVWNLERGTLTPVATGGGAVPAVRFSPDGTQLAWAGRDKTLTFWDVRTGQKRLALVEQPAPIEAIAWRPDGKLLATAGHDRMVRLVDAASGSAVAQLGGHDEPVVDVDFSPDGKLLASASHDRTIRVWDVEKQTTLRVLKGHAHRVEAVAFDRSGRALASASVDKTVRIWSVDTGRQVRLLAGHQSKVSALAFAPQGHLVATSGYDLSVRLWDLAARPPRYVAAEPSGPVNSVAFAPDGRILVSSGFDNDVRVWNVRTGELRRTLEGHLAEVTTVAVSPDGRLIASGSFDQTIRIWDRATGAELRVLSGHAGAIVHLAFSPDGRTLASAAIDRALRLWDPTTGALQRVLVGHDGPLWGVAFSPDGRLIASTGYDQVVRIWDAATGERVNVLEGHRGCSWGVVFDPSAARLATSGCDSTIRLWSLATGTGEVFARHGARVHWIAISSDGRRIVAPCADGTATIWSVGGGGSIVLRGHRGEVNTAVFSPDGSLVATAADDGTVRLWRSDTGSPVWRTVAVVGDPPGILTHRGWMPAGPSLGAADLPGSSWREAVAARAREARGPVGGGPVCVLTTDAELELWDVAADRQLSRASVPSATAMLPLASGCVTLEGGEAAIRDAEGRRRALASGATALAVVADQVLVGTSDRVLTFDASGHRLSEQRVSGAPSAVTLVDGRLVLGFEDGQIEVRQPTEATARQRAFEDVGASAVTRLLAGPTGTLIAGYADGTVGLWSLQDGSQLYHAHLHGPVAFLEARGETLYAASELGHWVSLDLSVFSRSYCSLMREVWRAAPVTWERGMPVLRPAPAGHSCSRHGE